MISTLPRPLSLLLMLALAGTGRAQVLPASDVARGEVRVLSYNILGGRGTDNTRDLGRVAEVIRALNPDLVSLQEVDVLTRRSGGVDIPAELAKATGMEVFFAEAMPHDGGKYGVAVMSRLPVQARRAHRLPNRPGHEPRAAAEIEVALPGRAGRLTFIGTHLDHTRDNATRRLQVAELVRLGADPARPALLAGDLNMEPASPEFADLRAAWKLTWPDGEARPTWSSDNPRERIDHILTRGAGEWKVRRVLTGVEVFPEDARWRELLNQTSDHLPVAAELTLPAE